jgi:crotonobetainyl-CoA:carnitine CoA-transferase CaiB-like acyl-CoA transferase
MTSVLDGIRVLDLSWGIAGPVTGMLLADHGADVVKVESPRGDFARGEPGFLMWNRGKRSVVLDLKTDDDRLSSERLLGSADVVLHNFPPERAGGFGLAWDAVHAKHPAVVVGLVSSYGPVGPLAGAPAYDLVAQARAGLLTAHASPGDRVPVRAGGIPMADLTAGFLLAAGVLAALVRSRETGLGDLVEVSLLAAAMAVQLQDLVWLPGEADERKVRAVDRSQLEDRAAEIAGGVAMNPYYRCFEAVDGFLAVACLNVAQRRAFLALFGLDDGTVEAPDLVPDDPAELAEKEQVTAEIKSAMAAHSTAEWLEQLEAAGVPCGIVQARETVYADPQVAAAGLIGDVAQPGLGSVRLLAPFVRVGDEVPEPRAAPELGADTESVLRELE